ncbi:MAG TPA: hypothetical protein DCF61_13110 [Alphaproteobacteria bacterium]|nr:hypothetical protein [Alphaproteobacteria bacterium]
MEATDSEIMNSGDCEEGPYRGVGYDLRRARLAANCSVADICGAIRISERHLQAIEAGQFAELPGSTYVSGFVRTYAGYVGLDPDEIILRLKTETNVPKLKPEDLHFPEPERESRAPSLVVVIAALLCAGLLYGAWYYFRQADWEITGDRDLVADVPARLQQQFQTAPDADAVLPGRGGDDGLAAGDKLLPERPTRAEFYNSTLPSGEEAALAVDSGAADMRADLSDAEKPLADTARDEAGSLQSMSDDLEISRQPSEPDAVPEMAAQGAEAVAMRQPLPKPLTAADARADESIAASAAPVPDRQRQMARGGNMQLRALDSVWIQFSNASGEVLLARVLAVDEVVPVPEGTDIRLTASDAGALVVLLNGERLPALGAAGEILRDLSLDPAELRARANR